ncbi:hypothetical protein AB838_01215 [Rhodobacteraceae bacterium (ex Bugula neritina AB1)]|nr:hypothetical protein AB838_01215 [Rhodobacteraceae bacterium (ex Bugula neritina AB1)]
MNIKFHRLRKPKAGHEGVSRRMFLMTTATVGVGAGAVLSGASGAFAALGDARSATLLRMVQDIYPHPDILQVSHYQAIVDTINSNAAKDAALAKDITEGLTRIDEQAKALFGSTYTEIQDDDAREGLLRHFQNDGFFQGIRWAAYFGIYDNKEIWPLFGYEGSSVEHGGYIDRGFSDITFVPEGPGLEERMAEVEG